jgi:sodium transport system permease protein
LFGSCGTKIGKDLMNEDPQLQRSLTGPAWTGRRQVLGRLMRLSLKELREILRDRRTIITLLVMPMLVYPLLAIVFQRFLLTSLSTDSKVEYVIGVDSVLSAHQLAEQLEMGEEVLKQRGATAELQAEQSRPRSGAGLKLSPSLAGAPVDEQDLRPTLMWVELPSSEAERQVIDASVHLGVIAQHPASKQGGEGLGQPNSWQLLYRPGSPSSEAAVRYVELRLRALNESRLDQQLKQLGVTAVIPAASTRKAVVFNGAPEFSLAALIPLILVLMTVTGAVYPAIDLTAGERERGTLEMLIAAPVPRIGLLLAKYVAVLTVALLTATINLLGMTITAHTTGLNVSLFGGGGLSPLAVVKVLLLLALFAAFFSAVLLAITSYARSFKEAQAYIIPLMLLCLVPGIICLMPSLQFTGTLAVVPLVNIVLLARDLLEGSVDPALAAAAVASTALYVVVAIGLAARIFGTDAVLYGSQSTWSDIFSRPESRQPALSVPAAMFALALMFPCYFVLAGLLSHSPDMAIEQRLSVAALVTAFVFGGVPWVIAMFSRVTMPGGAGIRKAHLASFVAAALLGAALWPAAHELFLFNQWLGITTLGADKIAAVKNLLDEWQNISPAWILLTLAIVPGVFEELFFRGFFFTSLQKLLSPWKTILVTAILFGLFHVVAANVLAPERFLPSAFLGVALGWVRYRSNSVLPCMLLHAVHNGLLLSVIYWRDSLAAAGIGMEENAHVPATWMLLAGVAAIAGIAVLAMTSRPKQLTA